MGALRSGVVRSDLWLILKIAVVTILTIGLFFNDFTILFNDALQNETTSYMLAIPFILAYMLYRKRTVIGATITFENIGQTSKTRTLQTIAGILTITTAMLMYWYGSYTFTPIEYHMMTMPVFTAGLILVLFNLQTLRQLLFPIAFLVFLIPPPEEILYAIGGGLSSISSEISNGLVQTIGIPSIISSEYSSPAILITQPNGTQIPFIVDIACSGIYSLLGFLVFVLLIVYVVRDKIWKKIALTLTGILIIYAFNITRITTILIIGYNFGENLALQFFHLIGSWVFTFIGTLLLLVISEKILKTKIFSNTREKCLECGSQKEEKGISCQRCGRILKPKNIQIRKSDLIKTVATITLVVLFLSIQAPVFAITQTPANIIVTTPTGQTASTEIFPNPPNYLLEFENRDTVFEETSTQDMSLMYIYYPEKANLQPIWVALEIAPTRTSLHRWETCLYDWTISQGRIPQVTLIELYDIQMNENPPIICRYFVFQYTKTNQIQSVLYWYNSATFNINSTIQQENVKISLIGYPENINELESIKNQQLTIARNIIDYWEPVKMWSATAMLISTNGAYLAATTSLLLAAVAIYYVFLAATQRKANRRAYMKLFESDKKIIDAIRAINKKTLPTLSAISIEHQKATNQTIDKDKLLQMLTTLAKEHIITSQITNQGDEPIQTWKA